MKKGEISTSFLVGVVLTIMAGIVLILVFTSIDWDGKSDEEVCKSSVLLRGSVPEMAKGYTPLNCKTEKLCIVPKDSSSESNCEELFKGVEDIKTEKVSSKEFVSDGKMDAKTEIEKIISKKVVDCWEMMGSGKISIENSKISESYGLGKTTSFCVVCSRIDIDPNILDRYNITQENLSTINPFIYMKTRKYPETDGSYLDYITGSGSNGRGAAFGTDYSLGEIINFDSSTQGISQTTKKDFSQMAIVFSQAYAPETGEVWDTYLKTAIVGGIGGYKLGLTGIGVKVASALGVQGLTVVSAVFALAAGGIQLNVWNNQALTASYCGDLTYSDGSKKGCSVVRVMPYNASELSSFCGVIDGLP